MTVKMYLICYSMFIGAQLLHLLWIKIPALRKRFKAANVPFSMNMYFKEEWNFLLGAQLACVILMLGWDQLVLNFKPEWSPYSKWIFFVMGGWGTSIALAKWGQVDKAIQKIVDVKSNVSDAVTGGTSTVQETIDKGTEATGVKIESTQK